MELHPMGHIASIFGWFYMIIETDIPVASFFWGGLHRADWCFSQQRLGINQPTRWYFPFIFFFFFDIWCDFNLPLSFVLAASLVSFIYLFIYFFYLFIYLLIYLSKINWKISITSSCNLPVVRALFPLDPH